MKIEYSFFIMEEFSCHQPEEDAPRPAVHAAKRPAGKGALSGKRRSDPEEDDIPERPNLIEIFDEFDVPEDERILLCSTTAAFYRALNKKRKNKD